MKNRKYIRNRMKNRLNSGKVCWYDFRILYVPSRNMNEILTKTHNTAAVPIHLYGY